jgi:regulator of protease activity HflC (stomatin/prohibitin superfamily)
MDTTAVLLVTTIMIIIVVIIVMVSSMRTIQPNECGVLVILGQPRRILLPGFNFVPAIISKVHTIKMDDIMWESELNRYRSKRFPAFTKEIEKFKAEVKDIYGFMGK